MRVFRAKHAMSFQSAVSSCVISSTTSQSIRRTFPWRTNFRSQWSAARAPWPRFCAAQCVLATMRTACFCSRSAATMRRARWVLPVPGKPVRSKEPPAKQCAKGSGMSLHSSSGGIACSASCGSLQSRHRLGQCYKHHRPSST